MRRTALCLTAVVCLPTLLGCQTTKGGLGNKSPAVSTEPVQDPDYYADSFRSPDAYQPYELDQAVAASDSTPTLSAALSAEPITPAGARFHTVAKGDTLYALARRYYSDQRRWKDIFAANRDSIGDANKIRIGQRLMIP